MVNVLSAGFAFENPKITYSLRKKKKIKRRIQLVG